MAARTARHRQEAERERDFGHTEEYGLTNIYCPACGEWAFGQQLVDLWPEPYKEQWECPNCHTRFRFMMAPVEEEQDVVDI